MSYVRILTTLLSFIYIDYGQLWNTW